MLTLLFYSLVGGLFSLVGGLLLLWKPQKTLRVIVPLLAFSAGAFLSAVFFDILPEAIELSPHPEIVLQATLLGFTVFFTLERLLMKFYKKRDEPHHHSEHTETLPTLLILGDSLHNFMDGIAIGLTYLINPALGLITTITTAGHEIPQEIGDFSILLRGGWPRAKILWVNILQSLLTIPGAFLGYYLGQEVKAFLPQFLGFTAGIFLYIAASDLVPELHHRSSHKHFWRIILPFTLAILFIFMVIKITHAT